jgi:hypothetical protein
VHFSLPDSSSPGLTGRSSIPETAVLEPRGRGVLGPPPSRRTTASVWRLRCDFRTWLHILAARSARGLHQRCPSRREGAGNAGCALHPRSRVQIAQKNAHTSIQVQRRQSGIPCAIVLRLMPRSPRRRIRLVTVAAGLMADTIRLDRYSHRQLGTSNGCQDHTVLPYATSAVRLAHRLFAHRSKDLPCEHLARRRCRVHRIPSRVRDDSRSAPLGG